MDTSDGNSGIASAISAMLMISAFIASVSVWYLTEQTGFLFMGAGFLLVAPVWYQAPVTISVLTAPVGSNVRNPRKLSKPNLVLTFIGYPLIVIGVCIVLFL